MIFFMACGGRSIARSGAGVEASMPLRGARVWRANCSAAIVSVAKGWTLLAAISVSDDAKSAD